MGNNGKQPRKRAGRTSRDNKRKDLRRQIAEVESGRYLATLRAQLREIEYADALAAAGKQLGPAGRRMVMAMLTAVGKQPEKAERVRTHLLEAGLAPEIVRRLLKHVPVARDT
jgi:hypothetical protein